mmetsp:Transcript_41243/g.118632  ORF Transcript_41243/g.118632 Transcript_41243/m.118632 type:complete len:412 (+) Transcript_41243:519-1754(+)
MVVDEEEHLIRLVVLQPHPHSRASTIPLVRAVLCDVRRALAQQSPVRLVVGNAEGVRPGERLVLAHQARIAEHPADALALLERHDVEPGVAAALDEVARAAAVASTAAEQVPPEEVVRQHLDLHALPVAATVQSPTRHRLRRAAPLALSHHAPRRLPTEAERGAALRRDRPVIARGSRQALVLLQGVLRVQGQATRPGAIRPRILVQDGLELLEARALLDAGVRPGPELLQPLRHGPHNVAVAWLAWLGLAAVQRLLGHLRLRHRLGRVHAPPSGGLDDPRRRHSGGLLGLGDGLRDLTGEDPASAHGEDAGGGAHSEAALLQHRLPGRRLRGRGRENGRGLGRGQGRRRGAGLVDGDSLLPRCRRRRRQRGLLAFDARHALRGGGSARCCCARRAGGVGASAGVCNREVP